MEKDCYNCRFEHYLADELPCIDCGVDDRKYWKPKPMTNADRIRAMTDEELAYWALHKAPEIGREYNESYLGLIKWLQQPAEGD